MAFPTSPSNGQTATVNGIKYVFATATNSWSRLTAANATFTIVTDTFTGDGSTTSFNLSTTPAGKDFITVNIDGISQLKTAYNLANNTITFTGTPLVGAVIEVKTWTSSNTSVLTGLVYDSFTGTGSQTNFTLSSTPTNRNFTLVSIGGITQNKTNYTVSGTTLTFSTAPPNTAPIEVVTFGPAINTATASGANTQIQFNSSGQLGGSANLTFNSSTNTLNATNITANGVAVASTSKSIAMSIVFGG